MQGQTVESYSTNEACRLAGVTFRQADYWARIDVLAPSVLDAEGSGTHRRYSGDDVALLFVAGHLREAGVSLAGVKSMVEQTRRLGVEQLNDQWLVVVDEQCFVVASAESALTLLISGQVAYVMSPLSH